MVEIIDALAAPILDRAADNTHLGRVAQDGCGFPGIIGVTIFEVGVDRQVGRLGDNTAVLQKLGTADRALPATRPSALDMPRLVVTSASKPTDASSFAVPASHGLGRIKIPGRWCSSRNRRPFSTWVRMTVSPDYRANTGLAAPT